MSSYDTLSEAVTDLRKRGYMLDFNLEENCILCHRERFDPDDFEIVEFYRFEGNSDPADESIIYAIESKKGDKGILVSGYGISAEGISADLAQKLQIATNK